MKTKTLGLGMILACLLLCLQACTPAQTVKPLQVHAADPVTVTKTEYVTLAGNLLAPVESAWGFANVWSNGSAYGALTHDSRWLDTCKGQLDGIRATYAAWLATHPAPGDGKASRTVPASVPKAPSQ